MDERDLQYTDPLASLKQFTQARIAIGRTGNSIRTQQSLAFNLAHAHARDAVYSELDIDTLFTNLRGFGLPVLMLRSKADNRQVYLQRPDLGRRLSELSVEHIADHVQPSDVAIVIADGLSAQAINNYAHPLLGKLIPMLKDAGLSLAPLSIVEQGRVAIADDIGQRLVSRLSIILIGERPGLSAADSMGAYITYNPLVGNTDDARNCISNIRNGGLDMNIAVAKIHYLITEAIRLKLSGVGLKDNAGLLAP